MYSADENRYDRMKYRRCGRSGILLPQISLGFWHNFGGITPYETQRQMLRTAFDNGITHFDLANNYGPVNGEAEENFGRHLQEDFLPYRDELFISTKAGYGMWPGPYGDHGSRKYLVSSLDQSLKRMKLDYVDVFYHHRPDPDTPLEETMGALDYIVRSGRALYIGLSNYGPELSKRAFDMLRQLGTPCLIVQPSYSMLNRHIENGLTDVLKTEKVGCICFAPLQYGLLTGKYLSGIPQDSRASRDPRFLKPEGIKQSDLDIIAKLNDIAEKRGQKLSQLALQWVLRDEVVTSALIGASRPEQIVENIGALSFPALSAEELGQIERILNGEE